ncbi:hypothetical protein AX14_012145 [Amanita brunnescens Koide BX004]|nr:hypothetical protein AX14_012145 [Amanita brunnescens Koide BX004]
MLLGGGNSNSSWSPTWSPTLVAAGSTAAQKHEDEGDASVFEPKRSLQETVAHDVLVVQSVTAGQAQTQLYLKNLRPGHSSLLSSILHALTAWVVEKPRHFIGELFSVSPWMAKRLEGLFVLNERVALGVVILPKRPVTSIFGSIQLDRFKILGYIDDYFLLFFVSFCIM